uniref:Exocyst subunit Exo70 family protein n=1 Tax=Oryza glumipatula TaxID=40148 RepID=A0A0D9ZY97_9ORYZ
MEPQLPTVISMEWDSATEPAESSPPSRRYSYLERIRNLSVVSAEAGRRWWPCSSSSTARSSYYSSSMSSSVSGTGFQNQRDFDREPDHALERWFSELDVGWVLRSAAEKELAAKLGLDDLVQRWTRGYAVMVEALVATQQNMKSQDHTNMELEDDLRPLQVTRFVEATVSKMLAFADALAADNTWRPIDKLSRSQLMCLCTSINECGIRILSEIIVFEFDCIFSKMNGAFSAIYRMAKDAEAIT